MLESTRETTKSSGGIISEVVANSRDMHVTSFQYLMVSSDPHLMLSCIDYMHLYVYICVGE